MERQYVILTMIGVFPPAIAEPSTSTGLCRSRRIRNMSPRILSISDDSDDMRPVSERTRLILSSDSSEQKNDNNAATSGRDRGRDHIVHYR